MRRLTIPLFCAVLVAAGQSPGAELTEAWRATHNAPVKGSSSGQAIATDTAGNIYVLGATYSPDTHQDYLTLKYDPQGHLLWKARYDRNGEEERPAAIAVDAEGNVYVTGSCVPAEEYTDFATVKYDAEGNQLWVAHYDNPDSWYDNAIDIALDPEGNVVVAGSTFLEDRGSDYIAIQYDRDGNEVWKASVGSERHDNVRDMAIDPEGNVYLTGRLDFETATVKLDAEGRTLWTARSDGDGGYAVALDPAGNVYVAGTRSNGGDDFFLIAKYSSDGETLWEVTPPKADPFQWPLLAVDPEGAVYLAPSSGSSVGSDDEFLVVKYDADGASLWQARRPSGGSTDLALDAAGGVLVSGYVSTPSSSTDYVTARYEAATGRLLWAQTYDGPGTGEVEDTALAVAADPSGNAVVTGVSLDDCEGCSDPTSACATLLYDAQGRRLWLARDHGLGNRGDYVAGLVLDPEGNPLVAGSSRNDTGRTEFSAVLYDKQGEELWAVRDGTPGLYEYARAVAADSSGNVYVTGESGDPMGGYQFLTVKRAPDSRTLWRASYQAGHYSTARAIAVDAEGFVHVTGDSDRPDGGEDYATVKYDPDGRQLWVSRYDGGGRLDEPVAIALDPEGNVFVSGNSGPSRDSPYDYVTIKYDPEGSVLWVARYHGPAGEHRASALAVDARGEAVVTGVIPHVGTPGEILCATVKYDPDGNEMWVASHAVTSIGAVALALDPSGNVHLAGPGGTTVKRFPDGSLAWSVDREDAYLGQVAVDTQGHVYVAGTRFVDVPLGWVAEALLIRYDADGALVSEASHPLRREWTFDVAGLTIDRSGSVYLAGTSELTPWIGDFLLLKYVPDGGPAFVRGDCDDDGTLGLQDVIHHLEASFITGEDLSCEAACDSNGDGKVLGQIGDPIYLLRFVFFGGSPPPPPFPECGTDPEGTLGCASYTSCP